MASYNFNNYSTVKVNGTDISTVKFNGSTIWTKPPATRSSFTYSTSIDALRHGQTSSNSKTFGGLPVAGGSTSITIKGYHRTHTGNHGVWNNGYGVVHQARYQVALYGGSTHLHTTPWSRWLGSWNGNFNITWNTNTSKDITKAILYVNGSTNHYYGYLYCHSYTAVTLTIG